MAITIDLDTNDGDGYETVRLPSKMEVCGRCEGRGTHDLWEGGMTSDQMAEQGPEFYEDYMDGVYSTTCTECKGRNVVEVVDRDRCDPELLTRYDKQQQEIADMEAMQAAEMRAEEYGAARLMGIVDYY